MTSWTTRFQQHSLHAGFDPLLAALDTARQLASEHEQRERVLEAVTRLHHVLGSLRRRVAVADPLAASLGDLDAIANGLNSIRAQVDGFLGSRNVAHLINANNEADPLTVRSLRLPPLTVHSEAEPLADVLMRLNDSSRAILAELDKEAKEAGARATQILNELKAHGETLKRERERLDVLVSQHQQQFSEAQSRRQQAFDTAENRRREHAAASVADWTQKLSAVEQAGKKRYEEEAAVRAKSDAEFLKMREESTHQIMRQLDEHLTNAKRIVGLIAGTGMAGGYQRDANVERRAFWAWSSAAVGSFVGMICFAVALFDAAKSGADFGWAEFVGRFVAVAAFGVFASYAARMAGAHRESERKHRHKQLALESVNAFLNDLEPKVREEVKRKMADAFFMLSEQPSEKAATPSDMRKDILDLINAIAKLRG